jgi:hypothetical protein
MGGGLLGSPCTPNLYRSQRHGEDPLIMMLSGSLVANSA